jgi:hypothetical protein
MGHINITGTSLAEVRQRRDEVAHLLGLPPFSVDTQP